MERITAAAIKVGDKVYTGATHMNAMCVIIDLPNVSSADKAEMLLAGQDGFVTDTGRFVSREEAYVIAQAAKQLKDLPQSEPEFNKEFYNSEEPRLDSGLIEKYAPLKSGVALAG